MPSIDLLSKLLTRLERTDFPRGKSALTVGMRKYQESMDFTVLLQNTLIIICTGCALTPIQS